MADGVRKLDNTAIKSDLGKVESLAIYPIKGMKGIEVKSCIFNNLGFLLDRRWMLVDERGRFLSQREVPILAGFKVSILNSDLLVRDPRQGEIKIPFVPLAAWNRRASVWGSTCRVDIYGPEVDQFFSDSLGRKCHLVKMSTEFRRTIAPYYSVNPGDSVSFADGFPFLITTTASLNQLSERVGEDVPMDRFRANIVVRNSIPFDEDRWRVIRIGKHIFHLVKPCARCVVTTMNQDSGEVTNGEPLRTLSEFRTTRRAGKTKVLFGQNAVAEDQQGVVNKGDSVVLLKTRRRPSFG